MWFLGAVLGAVVAAKIYSELWILGALFGGIIGWILGSRARQRNEEHFKSIEERLRRLEETLQHLEQRSLSPVSQPVSQPDSGRAPLPGRKDCAKPAALEHSPETAHILATDLEPAVAAAIVAEPAEIPPPPPAQREEAASPAWEWLLRGNLMARAGIVILFFGFAFLLKYSYQHIQMPIELRLAAVALGAVLLLVIGWRLRLAREAYGLALQGGGVGLLYLTIFSALRLYGLLPAAPAFALLLAVVALSALLAVLQDSLALAMLGAAGGFLAPILTSTGEGSHVALFSYYAVLNAGILAIAWFKAWRLLNLLGFVFTFGIATLWGSLHYRPDLYASTEPFLLLFFLIYVAIAVLFARRAAGPVERHLDTTLVFGVPLISFGLQVGLVREFTYGSAWSALVLGAFYLLLASTLWSRRGEGQRLLVEAFLALGVVFATLAIPLAFDGRWTSAAWAIEGAAIVWVGVRQQRLLARLFGMLLQLLAGFFYVQDKGVPAGDWPVLNSVYLGALLLALAGLFCAWLLQRHRQELHPAERRLQDLLFVWGILWWAGGGLHEIDRHLRNSLQGNAALVFFTVSSLLFSRLERCLSWPQARYPALALLPLMVLLALRMTFHAAHPGAHFGYLVWPLALAAHLLLLHRHAAAGDACLKWLHAAGLWLLAAIAAWELAWAIDWWVAGRAAWPLIAWALVPGSLLALLALRGERLPWPVAAQLETYLVAGGAPLAIFLASWFVFGNVVSDGNPWPLPYLPLLNPLDLAQAGALLVLCSWFVEVRRLGLRPLVTVPLNIAWSVLAAALFLWTNAVLLRTLHHWAGVPLYLPAMLRSDLVQASLSLFWTLLALATMVLATRRVWRPLWLAGAGLMTVVVVKLLLVDLSNAGTIERIVSFLGVGGLMLVIAYLAPVPPRQERSQAS
ncbi:MAG TPA: DUF2339 domain-containing protein [Candidatus Accumulibacter phosphatis]|nr:DUF2339 domain-containing protein [Candidatus Accumulibacter phosphatis]